MLDYALIFGIGFVIFHNSAPYLDIVHWVGSFLVVGFSVQHNVAGAKTKDLHLFPFNDFGFMLKCISKETAYH